MNQLDLRLLRNFYLNKVITTLRLILVLQNVQFKQLELIYNINANEKIFNEFL